MFVRSTVRRFRATPLFRGMSGFAAFLKSTKGGNFPSGPGSFRARSKAVAAAWRKLSTAEKAKFTKAGAKLRVVKRKKVARKPNAYAKWVKKNFNTVRGSAPQRIAALAKKWKAQQ